MKKILFFLLLAFGGATAASAQVVKAAQVIRVSVPTVQCNMCKGKIEKYLKRHDGVNSVVVNVKKKEVVVKYLVDRISDEEIKAAIANAGYDADEVPANPDSYKALPRCCKVPDKKD